MIAEARSIVSVDTACIGGGADDIEGHSPAEPRARRDAAARLHQRRRLTTLGTLVAIAAIVLLALDRSGPGNAPPARAAGAAAPTREDFTRLAAADKAIDAVLGYTPYVTRGSRKGKKVALTFDDGPGPTTPALLRYLIANGVPATFFLVGRAIQEHPGIVRRMSEAGFTLATHTDSHARLKTRSAAEQSREILAAADRIMRVTGHAVRLFRPPYGLYDERTLSVLNAHRMLMVLWSVNTRDFVARSSRTIVSNTLRGSRGGSIVLMHDGPGARPRTLEAVRKIVTTLRRRGYRLVSLPKLLQDDPPPRRQPLPHRRVG